MSRCDAGCPVPDRREFLKQVTLALGAAMATLSASPREAAALPMALGRALQVLGDEVSYPIPTADGATIDKQNEVILVRWSGAIYAFTLSCPHQNTALRWLGGDGRFQCPKHKSKYQPDGAFMSGRATRNMDRFAVRKEGKNIIVNLARLYRSDRQQAQWTAARVST
jgi:nitrite reductase/ring-hydroxylating ferredoxin subunit